MAGPRRRSRPVEFVGLASGFVDSRIRVDGAALSRGQPGSQALVKHTLRVVRDPFGWTVCLGAGMTSPFRTRAGAIREAECLCQQLRAHGEAAEIVIEESVGTRASGAGDAHAVNRLVQLLRDIGSRGQDTK